LRPVHDAIALPPHEPHTRQIAGDDSVRAFVGDARGVSRIAIPSSSSVAMLVLHREKQFFAIAATMGRRRPYRTPQRGDRLRFPILETAMPLLTFSRADDRAVTDLLGEVKAVNRLFEKRYPACTVALLSQGGPVDAPQRITVELEGPPAEVDESASWLCAQLRERGILCEKVVTIAA
jgi:hypothetical protein